MISWYGEIAHHMAALPAFAAWHGRHRSAAVWLLVGVFLVSWLADWPAHFTHAWGQPVSIVYPLSQAGLVALVFLPRPAAGASVVGLTLLGILAALLWGAGQVDLPFRAACWGAAVLLLWPRRVPLRNALLVYLGLGLVAWAGYVAWPGWTSWGAYQGVRLAGILLACGALWNRLPQKAVA